jgi:hypothetical protein
VVVSAVFLHGYLTLVKDLVCPECSSSISFASASLVASCTMCGADLDLSNAEPAAVALTTSGDDMDD